MIAAAPQKLYSGASGRKGGEILGLDAFPAQRLAQLQAIYNGAPVGLCFLDRNLHYVSLNQHLADMNCAPIAAHIGKTVQEIIPALFARVQPYLLRALQGEAIEGVEASKPPRNPGDPDTTLLLSYQPVFDEAHEVIGVSVAIMDITERKVAVKALRESEEHYRHLVELSPIIPWVADTEGNVIEISSRWVQLTGMSKEQALRLGWLEALHPKDAPHTLKAVRESLHTGKPFITEFRVKSADGKWRWMLSRGWPRYGPAGEVFRWYGGVEDIEERKQLEAALRQSRARRRATESH
jgi:PAS domain S-box-containing protein